MAVNDEPAESLRAKAARLRDLNARRDAMLADLDNVTFGELKRLEAEIQQALVEFAPPQGTA
jgi:hypothetical protein